MDTFKSEIEKCRLLDKKLQSDCPMPTRTPDTFSVGGEEYLVLTDSEADEAAKDAILESLWAFRYNFLCGHSDIISAIDEDVWKEMMSKKCESANDMVKRMISDLDYLVEDAIRWDGRGHFLASYDSEEIELGENCYAYRIN